MNYKNTLKAAELLESKKLFITGNFPNKTEGFISKFLYTKSFNIDDITKKLILILMRVILLYLNNFSYELKQCSMFCLLEE